MKKLSFLAAFSVFLGWVLAVSAFGQERTISNAEYDKLDAGARAMAAGVPLRVTSNYESSDSEGKAWTNYLFTVEEFNGSGSSHFRAANPSNKFEILAEIYLIGGKFYSRKESGPWKVELFKVDRTVTTVNQTPSCVPPGCPETTVAEAKYLYSVGSVDVFQKITKHYDPQSRKKGFTDVESIWIRPDGRLARTHRSNMDDRSGKEIFYRADVMYEYDPTIKIVAPDVTAKESGPGGSPINP